MKYDIAWDVIASAMPFLAKGVLATLEFTALSVAFGLVIGIAGVAARVGSAAGLRWTVGAYVEIVRNTPMLVQLYFIFYGLPRLNIRLDSNLTAIVALSLYCGAYVIEIMRGGVEAVGRGQIEAARALGLTEVSVFSNVVLPQAFRAALPALGGQVIAMVKLSSLASAIGAVELTYYVVDVVSQTYRSFELYAVAGLIYLGLTLLVAALFRALEMRTRR